MFIVTAKFTKKKMALAAGVLAAVILAAVLIFAGGGGGGGASETFKGIKTDEDRVAFLSSYGWEVEEEPVEIRDVTIPKEFDAVYTRYNELQLTQDCDLTKYRGKEARRYTYRVTNHPSGETEVYANLLVYKNKIIGGDVCSAKYRGFMQGFERQGE